MSTIEFNESLLGLETNLYSFAMSFTRDSESAKDLTQETFLKAIQYKASYKTQTNFKAWVMTIMRNTFINQYRRTKKGQQIDEIKKQEQFASAMDSPTPLSEFSYVELNNKIDTLEEEFKIPFMLHYQGFKYKEISKDLDLPIGTVKSRIFTARKKLMVSLPEYS